MKKDSSRSEVNWGRYAQVFSMFDKAGVPHDTRWRSLLLYFREIKDYTHLTDAQKMTAQRLLAEVIEKRIYTDSSLRKVLNEYHNMITAPYKRRIEELLHEATGIIAGFQELLTCRYGDVNQLEETTITCIEQEGDEAVLLEKLRASFKKVKSLLEEDI